MINNVFLTGKIVKVYKYNKENAIKIYMISDKRTNTVIPVVFRFKNESEKREYLSFIRVGNFISIKGIICLKYNKNMTKNEMLILANKCFLEYSNNYSNVFKAEVTRISNVKRGSNKNSISFNVYIKDTDSLRIHAFAYGKYSSIILHSNKNERHYITGSITMNKYNNLSLKVNTFSKCK